MRLKTNIIIPYGHRPSDCVSQCINTHPPSLTRCVMLGPPLQLPNWYLVTQSNQRHSFQEQVHVGYSTDTQASNHFQWFSTTICHGIFVSRNGHQGDILLPDNMRYCVLPNISQIIRFMWPTWGPPGSCRPQAGPMLAPWTLLSGIRSFWYSSGYLHPSYCTQCPGPW